MIRFIIASILISTTSTFCFGYVCVPRAACYRNQYTRSVKLAVGPTLSPNPTSLSATEAQMDFFGLTPTKLSKRKRLSNLVKRIRGRLSLTRFVDKNHEGKMSSINETLRQVESKEAKDMGGISSKENITIADHETVSNSRTTTAANDVDLSGTWSPIVTSAFKKEYDSYLLNCSQSYMFRKVVVNGIGYQKETIQQEYDGVKLKITATNPAGDWSRTLISSDELRPMNVTITDPDGDRVEVEAWWEDDGTKHKSLLRGKPRVEGGVFETVRYLESDNVLVCDSSFIPSPQSPSKFKYGHVVWKFQREES